MHEPSETQAERESDATEAQARRDRERSRRKADAKQTQSRRPHIAAASVARSLFHRSENRLDHRIQKNDRRDDPYYRVHFLSSLLSARFNVRAVSIMTANGNAATIRISSISAAAWPSMVRTLPRRRASPRSRRTLPPSNRGGPCSNGRRTRPPPPRCL